MFLDAEVKLLVEVILLIAEMDAVFDSDSKLEVDDWFNFPTSFDELVILVEKSSDVVK